MKPVIWVIDEEWSDYNVENALLKKHFPECEIHYSKYEYADDLGKFGGDVDGILAQVYTTIGEKEIPALKKCRVISVFGGGYDRINVKCAKEYGIKVAYVPGYCIEDVSDYAIAAIFNCNKHITSYAPQIQSKLWGSPALPKPGQRINGAKLLIIGLGRIGSAVAGKALSLGMDVSAYDPYVDSEKMNSIGVKKNAVLHDALAEADYVSIHAKLTPETCGMIGKNELSAMKKSAYMINTARGSIIDERAMIDSVNGGIFAGAVLDVVDTEPPTFKEEIFHTANILVTPHISYLSVQAYDELKRRAAENLINILSGKAINDIAE